MRLVLRLHNFTPVYVDFLLRFVERLKKSGLYVATGQFGAMMEVNTVVGYAEPSSASPTVNIENDREGCSRRDEHIQSRC